MHSPSNKGTIIALLLIIGLICTLALVQEAEACNEGGKGKKGGYGKMKYKKVKPEKPWKAIPIKEKKFLKAKAGQPMVNRYYGGDGEGMVQQGRGYYNDQGYPPMVSRSNGEPARGTTRRAFAKLLDAGVDRLLEHRKNRADYGDYNRYQNSHPEYELMRH